MHPLYVFFLRKSLVSNGREHIEEGEFCFKDYKSRFSVTSSLVKLLNSFSEILRNGKKRREDYHS